MSGQVWVHKDDLDDLAEDLEVRQWRLETDPSTPAVHGAPGLREDVPGQVMKELGARVRAAGGNAHGSGMGLRAQPFDMRRLQLGDAQELWVLHHLARYHLDIARRTIRGELRQRPSLVTAEELAERWAWLSEVTTPLGIAFPGLRLAQSPGISRAERRLQVDSLGRFAAEKIEMVRTTLTTREPSTPSDPLYGLTSGLIRLLTDYLNVSEDMVDPQARAHLQGILDTSTVLDQRIEAFVEWAAARNA